MIAEPSVKPPKSRRILLVLCVVAVGMIGLAVSGVIDRARSRQEVAAWTNEQAISTVRLVQPERGPSEEQLILPGTVNAFSSGTLFARASGYVSAWHKDIGARVTKGEILATISAPDLDQQLVEAKAQLMQLQAAVEQAQANADLGQATDQRTSRLVVQGWSSKEQGDTDRLTAASRVAALAVAKANVAAQQAAVGRLEELTRFEMIKAPFDGVVTARTLDPGSFASPNQSIYQLSQIDPIYVDFNVKDTDLAFVAPGTLVSFTTSAHPERRYTGRVASVNAQPANGTLLYRARIVERNPDSSLRGGLQVSVRITKQVERQTLVVPRGAVVQNNGTGVIYTIESGGNSATAGATSHVVRALEVRLGLQTDVYVAVSGEGLRPGMPIVLSQVDNLHDGATVRIPSPTRGTMP